MSATKNAVIDQMNQDPNGIEVDQVLEPGHPNWLEVNKLRDDLRSSQRECNLMLKRIEDLKAEKSALRAHLARCEGDYGLMQWLATGHTSKKLESVLLAWHDESLQLPPDIRIVMTHVAKEGV